MKRVFDIGLVVLTAPLWLPLMALTALAVFLALGRPVFFVQERPGLKGRPFRLIKFRTMRSGDAPDEERLTRLGKFLRGVSLDELPELWNVLRGEMALVGPRPLLMRYLPLYTECEMRRHDVLPGITGWAQVNGRNALSWEQKFALDLWYVENRTLMLDGKILLMTAWKVLRREGIAGGGELLRPQSRLRQGSGAHARLRQGSGAHARLRQGSGAHARLRQGSGAHARRNDEGYCDEGAAFAKAPAPKPVAMESVKGEVLPSNSQPVSGCEKGECEAFTLEFATSLWLRKGCEKGCENGVRDAVVGGWVFVSLLVFVASEALAAFGRFDPSSIRTLWLVLAGAVLAGVIGVRGAVVRAVRRALRECAAAVREGLRLFPAALPAAALILALTLIHALVAPSFDVDSLSYHLPRAVHWLVNGSLEFYETAIARQNYQAPLYSMCLAHLMALTRSDLLFNLIQWTALLVNAAALSLIARELGVGRRGQWLVALLSVGIPQVISQVIVSVNDLFAAAAVTAAMLYLVRFLRGRELRAGIALRLAAAMAVACLAKYTSLVHLAGIAVPLTVIGVVRTGRRLSWRRAAAGAALLAAAALAASLMLLPQISRNLRHYGDPFSGEPPHLMTTVNLTPGKLAVNWLRHCSMHAAFPLYALNRPVESAVRRVSGDLVEDPDITYQNDLCFTGYRIFTPLGKFSSNASNPVQFFLYAALLTLMAATGFRGGAAAAEYSVVPVVFGSLLYAAVFKYQPWCARLQIPYFMLMVLGGVLWLEGRRCAVKGGRVCAFLSLGYGVLHLLLLPNWYMPAFLYGELPASSGLGPEASLAQKISALRCAECARLSIRQMQQSVPPAMQNGYSIFWTERNRLYFGNQYHYDIYNLYEACVEVCDYIRRGAGVEGLSANVGLVISSDHGNTYPENASAARRPFSKEFLLWRLMDNISGEAPLRFVHFASGDPAGRAERCFGGESGVILSDNSRESVIKELQASARLEYAFSNRVFTVYYWRSGSEPESVLRDGRL